LIYYLYIIECQNNAYYTGYTTDIKRRYREHCNGSSKCKYTRSFPPKKLSAYWSMQLSLAEVLKLERAVKQLSKVQKKDLIHKPDYFVHFLQLKGYDQALMNFIQRGSDVSS
tara:strand:+ start:585 stop:920 length:336 start_codon:yes stop_codon:yes gene_type:complete